MARLHELIAVEDTLKARAQEALREILALFTTGHVRFAGHVKSYQPLAEDGERLPPETTVMATTVPNQLARLSEAVGDWWDVAVQKEIGNSHTGADVVIDGKAVLTGLPATALLNLESKLAELRKVLAEIPVNDPTELWTWDAQTGSWKSEPRQSARGQKVPRSIITAPATDHHPAQVHVYNEDRPVGTWTLTRQSGMYSPAQKQAILDRTDQAIRAVKEARQRANNVEVDTKVRVAQALFDYIKG